MKKRIKSFCAALLAIIIIFSSSATISDAASKQLIIINSKYNTLNFYENNILVKKFKCATGKASTPTPQRKTTIVNKIKNRPYYKLGIPGGDPRNPLGKRWMGLNMYGYGTTYGIHGTNNESSIGKNVSGGCIRMYNKDVEWLFNRIRVGATVIIKSTSNSDEWIAKQYGIKLKKTWYTQNGYKYYRKSNGKNAVGWNTIDGKTYYFDSKGRMQTGLKTISGNKYYLGTDGVRRTGWQTIKGSKYYFEKSGNRKGQAVKGKIKISGRYYYFDSNYKMITNKKVKIGDYYYYFDKDGKMVTDKKVKVGSYYYYFDTNGKMVKNKVVKDYYYGSDGKLVINKIQGNYCTDKNGKIRKNVIVNNYYFSSDGKMVKNKRVNYKNDYYYFDSNGKMVKNKEIGYSYYGENGKAYKSCVKDINGYTYTFNESGMITNKVEIKEDTNPEESTETQVPQENTQNKETQQNNEDTSLEEAV